MKRDRGCRQLATETNLNPANKNVPTFYSRIKVHIKSAKTVVDDRLQTGMFYCFPQVRWRFLAFSFGTCFWR